MQSNDRNQTDPYVGLTLGERFAFLLRQRLLSDKYSTIPTNTIHQPNVGPMLVHRLRRWPNIEPTLG